MSCIDSLPLTSLPVGWVRSGENALFSFSPNLAVSRNDPLAKRPGCTVPKVTTPQSEEQPHDETPLRRFYSCVAYVLLDSLARSGARSNAILSYDKFITKPAGAMMRTSQSESEFVSPGRESVVAQRRFALRPWSNCGRDQLKGATGAPPVMVCGQNNGG